MHLLILIHMLKQFGHLFHYINTILFRMIFVSICSIKVRTDTSLVRMRGLEPPHRWYWFLRPARLPVPPHPHIYFNIDYYSTLIIFMSSIIKIFIHFNATNSLIYLVYSLYYSLNIFNIVAIIN